VDPWKTTFVGETSPKEAGHADFVASDVFPSFSIEVRDASDNSLVREIEPQGGLDADLWRRRRRMIPGPG